MVKLQCINLQNSNQQKQTNFYYKYISIIYIFDSILLLFNKVFISFVHRS